MRARSLTPLFAAAALLWAGACSDRAPVPTPAPTAAASGLAAPADVAAAAPAASPAAPGSGERLTIGLSQEFETLNPLISQMAASQYIYFLVGHPLLAYNADWQLECWLCVQIPTLENGLAQVVERGGQRRVRANWEIRPGASWGDGEPITGRDVELSWQIASSPGVSVLSKEPYTEIAAIEIDPREPRRFAIELREARHDYADLASQMMLVPAHIEGPIWARTRDWAGAYEKQTEYTANPANPGLYSGPYRVSQIRLGSHTEVVRNERFYGPPAALERLVVKLVPNTQTLEANLISDTIGMVGEIGMTFDQALAFEKRAQRDPSLARFRAGFRAGLIYEHIALNLDNPILADLRVRKALLYAIDREELVRSLFENRQPTALHYTHPLDPYFSDEVTRYPFDPRRAAELLEEAGWRLGEDGYRHKDGAVLELPLMTTAQNKTRELVQVFLQEQWRHVGVRITIRNEPARVFFGETMRKREFEAMAMFAWTGRPGDPQRALLHSAEIPTAQNGWSGQNKPGFRNAEVDAALDRFRTEFDPEVRKALTRRLQQIYTEELPDLPLYLRAEIAVTPTRLQNYEQTGHQFYSTLRAQRWALQ